MKSHFFLAVFLCIAIALGFSSPYPEESDFPVVARNETGFRVEQNGMDVKQVYGISRPTFMGKGTWISRSDKIKREENYMGHRND